MPVKRYFANKKSAVKKSASQSLYTILQILSVTLFEKESIYQALSNVNYTNQADYISNQLNLFD